MTEGNSSHTSWLACLLVVAAVLGLTGPGQGFGDGVSGTGLGPISQFHSLVINGVHYDTTNAVVRINGVLDELANLRLGQQVAFVADHDNLSILEVDQYDAVSGKIEAITVHDPTLLLMEIEVAGQTVLTGLDTVFHHDKPNELKKGDRITVGGLRDPDGRIVASALEKGGDDELVSGIIDEIGDYHFKIGGLLVMSAYHAELVNQPWFVVGAGVLAEGKLDDGELEAERVMPVPEEFLTVQELVEFGESRVDGEIETYDPWLGELSVAGVPVLLDERTTMQDGRDEQRPFGLIDVYPGDHVSLAVERRDTRYYARKLVRVKKAERVLRGKIEVLDPLSDAITVLGRTLYDVSEIKDKRFAREKFDVDIRDVYAVADEIVVTLHPKTGRVKKLAAWSDCREVIAAALVDVDPQSLDKDRAKELEKTARDEDERLYACMKQERFKHWFD